MKQQLIKFNKEHTQINLLFNMERILIEKYGIQIILRDEKLYLRFDEGGVVVKFNEYEISCTEGIEALLNEDSAYKLCLKVQSRNQSLT